MAGGLNTEIEGSPGSIDNAAGWINGQLEPGMSLAASRLSDARRSAHGDWQSPAGEAFAAKAGTAVTKIDDMARDAGKLAQTLMTFADQLAKAQHRMDTIRKTAEGAGLTVSAFIISDPGAGPADPGPMPTGGMPSPAAVQAHGAAVAAFQEHQKKVKAYKLAAADVHEVQTTIKGQGGKLSDSYHGLKGAQWALNAADIAGGTGGGIAEFNAKQLKGSAKILEGDALRNLNRAQAADPAVVGKPKWYDDLDGAKKALAQADELASKGSKLDSLGKTVPLKLGGALAVAGIGLDIANGKDPVQAATSGAAGFGASVVAGTAIGGTVGSVVPVGGTIVGGVVGAVGGATVGIFTSGAVDSLFENGPDVGKAVDTGVDAVGDTGKAIGDAVGGLFD